MIRRVILVLAMILAWAPLATAAPTASFVVQQGRTGAHPAPHRVQFNALASQSSIPGDNVFRDLHYAWDFGDPASGNWSTDGKPRNEAIGAVASHLYAQPGTYTVTLTVTDALGAMDTEVHLVSVDDPDVVFALTTACASTSGNFEGCPAGAVQVQTASFPDFVFAQWQSGRRRFLFRRGEQFLSAQPYFTPTGHNKVLLGAFGPGTVQPEVHITAGNSGPAIVLSGNNVNTAATSGWTFHDLRLTSEHPTARGIGTSFIVDDVTLYRMDIGPTGSSTNFIPDQSGLNTPHDFMAVVDTQLRGQSIVNSSFGACWFGGANRLFIAGVTCTESNAWNMRIAYTNEAVIEHNRIIGLPKAGAFEGIKFQCSIGGPSDRPECRHMVFSDNVLPTRLNITAGGGADPGVITESIFERNVVPGPIQTENPGNLFRHNLVTHFELRGREQDFSLPRNNVYEGNTCDGRNTNASCIYVTYEGPPKLPIKYDGLEARDNLSWAPNGRPFFARDAGGFVEPTVQPIFDSNRVAVASPFAAANPSFANPTSYVLAPGGQDINSGVPLRYRSVDLGGLVAPQGSGRERGALELAEGAPPPDTTPPAPGVVTAVSVVP